MDVSDRGEEKEMVGDERGKRSDDWRGEWFTGSVSELVEVVSNRTS